MEDCSKGKKGKEQVSVEKAGGEGGLKRLVRGKGCGVDAAGPQRIENQKWNFELDIHLRGID